MKTLLAANWKMSLSEKAAVELSRGLAEKSRALKKSELWLTPSFTHIRAVADNVRGAGIKVGGQNAHWSESGAFTGEISCGMLKECGADYAIIGHSERRHVFFETDEMIHERARAVLKAGLSLIFCVGETLDERAAGETEDVLARQLAKLPQLLGGSAEVLVAYEPVWAIGTGKVAETGEIEMAHDFIVKFFKSSPPVLYGGSVTAENIAAISRIPNVSGALIGGASTSLEKFSALIEAVEN